MVGVAHPAGYKSHTDPVSQEKINRLGWKRGTSGKTLLIHAVPLSADGVTGEFVGRLNRINGSKSIHTGFSPT